MTFEYSRLPGDRHIRLLKLHPADSFTDDLRCELGDACLDDNIHYEALSYTWGEPEPGSRLSCNDAHLLVQQNLNLALRHLRSRHAIRTLWIDAVCINQADIEERNKQVTLMRDIYSKASQVVAWIGDERPIDTAAMDLDDALITPETPNKKDTALTERSVKLMQYKVAMMVLIRRPWFGRAWIIQEVALAKKVIVQCGQKTVRWESLYGIAQLLPEMKVGHMVQLNLTNPFVKRLKLINDTRQWTQTRRKSDATSTSEGDGFETLQSLVYQARLYGASDARDHIYALLGLINQQEPALFNVDYESPYNAIYRRFIRRAITSRLTLTSLGQNDSSLNSQLESWVPDLSNVPSVNPLSSAENPIYSASGDSTVRLIDSNSDTILVLSGIVIDTVEALAVGPSSDQRKVQTHTQRLALRHVDEVLFSQKMAFQLLSKSSPMFKELIDELKSSIPNPEEVKDDEEHLQAVPEEGMIRFYKRMADFFVECLDGKAKGQDPVLAKGALAMLSGFIEDTRQTRQDWLWGPVNPTNDVYMTPKLEIGWRDLAQKVSKYPTGEKVEHAYWRTLVGNQRHQRSGKTSIPPDAWCDVFTIWQHMLHRRTGVIPTFVKTRIFQKSTPISALPTHDTRTGYSAIPARLMAYIKEEDAKERNARRAEAMENQGLRNVFGATPTIIQTQQLTSEKPDDFIDTIAGSNQEKKAIQSNKQEVAAQAEDVYNDLSVQTQSEARSAKDSRFCIQDRVEKMFWYDMLPIAKNRQFAVTKKGYMGWVPPHAQKGDKVCLLFGGQVPYIIRPQGKEYRFLGEAYIHGIMNGEALQWDGIRMETIALH